MAGRTLAEVEEYIERCALAEMEKAGLWILAWAQQDQATQLRLAQGSARAPNEDPHHGSLTAESILEAPTDPRNGLRHRRCLDREETLAGTPRPGSFSR